MFSKTNGRPLRAANCRHRVYALFAMSISLALAAPFALADETNFDKPLFADSLFNKDDIGEAPDNATTKVAARPAGLNSVAQQINEAQTDAEFIRQLRRCAHWLQLYGIRNRGLFPGLANDEGRAAQVQLNELVPNNPYNLSYAQNLYQGTPAWTSPDGTPAAGSPVWADQWTAQLQAQNNNRIILSMDYGLTPDSINQYSAHPPESWDGMAPGTINCIGNGQGFFIVWGTGRDGKPVKNPTNGGVYIAAGSTSGLVNDQVAPNEDGIP